jgi:hypothetical protein
MYEDIEDIETLSRHTKMDLAALVLLANRTLKRLEAENAALRASLVEMTKLANEHLRHLRSTNDPKALKATNDIATARALLEGI